MAYLLEDIANHIIANKLSDELAKDIFTEYMPDNPSNLVTLSEYTGSGSALGMENTSNRSVQIRVRNQLSGEARKLSWSIYKLLDNPENREIRLKDRWTLMYPRQTPIKLSVDDKGRSSWIFNIGVTTNYD